MDLWRFYQHTPVLSFASGKRVAKGENPWWAQVLHEDTPRTIKLVIYAIWIFRELPIWFSFFICSTQVMLVHESNKIYVDFLYYFNTYIPLHNENRSKKQNCFLFILLNSSQSMTYILHIFIPWTIESLTILSISQNVLYKTLYIYWDATTVTSVI